MLKTSRNQQKYNVREELTKAAAARLNKIRDTKKSDLIKENESATNFFDPSVMKDHKFAKAKVDSSKREKIAKSIKQPPETRQEVLDYYEMNRKEIDKSYIVRPGEMEAHFKNMKK
jgi:hypothetical protein